MHKAIRTLAATLSLSVAGALPLQAAQAQAAPPPPLSTMSALNAEQCKAAWDLPQGQIPKGGVLIMATFDMEPYSYEKYRQAVAWEVPMMARNKVKFINGMRVLSGKMDRYVDFWWTCDYPTFIKGFYETAYAETNEAAKQNLVPQSNPLKDAVVEIVSVESF